MNKTCLVVDDFLQDPISWRETALSAEYKPAKPKGSQGYPGSESVLSFISPETVAFVAHFVGRPVSVGGGHFRAIRAEDTDGPGVHTDADFGAIHYLSLPQQCRGGTALYRHLATGLEQMLTGEAYDPAVMRRLVADTRDRAAWEQTLFVPMRFNRFVLFDALCFHSGTIPFGTSLDTSRLSQNFFINIVRPAAATLELSNKPSQ